MSQTGYCRGRVHAKSTWIFSTLRHGIRIGLPFAHVLGAVVAMVASGCLVTEPIDFPVEEDAPTYVVNPEGYQEARIGDVIVMPPSLTSFTLNARVVDANRSQELSYRLVREGIGADGQPEAVLVTGCDTTEGRDLGRVQKPATDTETRELSLPVERPTLSGCYRLRLVVSSSFSLTCDEVLELLPNVGRAFEYSGAASAGTATWWLFATDTEDEDNVAVRCPITTLGRAQSDVL